MHYLFYGRTATRKPVGITARVQQNQYIDIFTSTHLKQEIGAGSK